MASLAAPTNQLVAFVNTLLQCLLENVGEDATVAAGVAALPILSNPFLNVIFKWFVSKVAVKTFDILRPMIDKKIIAAQNAARLEGYNAAVADLKAALGQGDQSAIDKASNADNDAIDKLVNRNK